MLDDLKVDKFNAVIYNAVFAVRRFDILLVNLWLSQDSPMSGVERTFYLEKILFFISVQLLYISYIHVAKPHENPIFNQLELMNEYSLLALGYVMLMFSGLILQDTKFEGLLNYGRSLALLLLLFIVLLNLFTNMKIVTRKICLACKAKCAKKKM